MRWLLAGLLLVLRTARAAPHSLEERKAKDSLAQYVARPDRSSGAVSHVGQLLAGCGPIASLSTDYKAAAAGDLITIVVAHSLTSSNAGDGLDRAQLIAPVRDQFPARQDQDRRHSQPARPAVRRNAGGQGPGGFFFELDDYARRAGGGRALERQSGDRSRARDQHEQREANRQAAGSGAARRYRSGKHGRLECDRRSRTRDQGQGRGLERRAAAESGLAGHYAHFEFLTVVRCSLFVVRAAEDHDAEQLG